MKCYSFSQPEYVHLSFFLLYFYISSCPPSPFYVLPPTPYHTYLTIPHHAFPASPSHTIPCHIIPYLIFHYLILPYPTLLYLVSVLMKKDLRLAVDAAESRKIPLPTARLALSTYTTLCETGLSHKDFSVVYDHLSKMK